MIRIHKLPELNHRLGDPPPPSLTVQRSLCWIWNGLPPSGPVISRLPYAGSQLTLTGSSRGSRRQAPVQSVIHYHLLLNTTILFAAFLEFVWNFKIFFSFACLDLDPFFTDGTGTDGTGIALNYCSSDVTIHRCDNSVFKGRIR
jgi:hypothetical protein